MKNTISKLLLFTTLTLFIISCGQKSGSEQHAEHEHDGHAHTDHEHTGDSHAHDESAKQNSDTSTVNISDEEVQIIIAGYLQLKDALVETDATKAGNISKDLYSTLNESEDELIKKIRFDIEHISHTDDAGHQREHFNALSENIYTLVKSTSANESTLYKQYCPMAFDNRGAFWLSDSKEIMNPYFGDKMLKCGSVKEEI